ncbi:MAG: MFS transporter [Proteobacteria bacterium]|nr:MFS transporter [Pseudomonadota bacterium]
MTNVAIASDGAFSKNRTYAVLVALWLGHFTVDSFTGIWPIYKTLANLDLVKAGLIVSIGGFVGNSLQIFFGYLGDKGWSRFLLCFGVLAAAAVLLIPYIDNANYWLMGLLIMLTFLGSSAYHPSGTGTASSLSARKVGKLTALFLSGGFVGYAFSQLLFTKIYFATDGKPAIMIVMAVFAIGMLLLFSPPAKKQTELQISFWSATKGFRRPLTYLYIVMVCAAGINMVQVFLLPELLLGKKASTWMVYGGGHLVMVLGGCAGLLPAGHLADKYGPRQVMLGGLTALAILLPLTATFESESNLAIALLLFFLGFSGSTCNVVGVTYGSRLMPKHTRTVSGLLMGFAWCVAGISPFIGGWLADPGRGGSPESAFTWFLIAVAIAIAFTYLLPRTKKT